MATVKMEGKHMTKAEERINELKANGVDTSNYYALNADVVIKMVDGKPEIVSIENAIEDTFNRKLDGRWIMAQMFRMLNYKGGYTEYINALPYHYQWSFLYKRDHGKDSGELHRLARRERDGADLSIKELAFNSELVYTMINDYINKLKLYINSLPTKRFKNVLDYKRLGSKYKRLTHKDYGDIFVDDLDKNIYSKFDVYARKAKYARSYMELEKVVKEFTNMMIQLPVNTRKCDEFVDAYKLNGAYYTAMNMARFHGCRWDNGTKETTIQYINDSVKIKKGYEMLGFLKEFIKQNNFNF